MYKEKRIAILMPAYNEAPRIEAVLATIPDFVDYVIVINDGSTDDTAQVVNAHTQDRYLFINRSQNKGYGATLVEAHIAALEQTDADIMITMDSDGQMDPSQIPNLIDGIAAGNCEYAKGNRFFSSKSFVGMPKHRVCGNIVLTFLTKMATGYWSVFDPENGYTAIARNVSEQIDWTTVTTGWAYPNDVLFRLSICQARVKDISIPAIYGSEVSAIRLRSAIPSLVSVLWSAFGNACGFAMFCSLFRRSSCLGLWVQYFRYLDALSEHGHFGKHEAFPLFQPQAPC